MKVAWHRLKHWWRFQDEPFILYPVCWKPEQRTLQGAFVQDLGQSQVSGNQSAAWMGATGVNQSEKDKHGTGRLADWHLFLHQYSNWSLPVIASFIFTGCIFLSFSEWFPGSSVWWNWFYCVLYLLCCVFVLCWITLQALFSSLSIDWFFFSKNELSAPLITTWWCTSTEFLDLLWMSNTSFKRWLYNKT